MWRTTLTSSAALSTAVLPVFLLGALSDAIRSDLGLDETAIGAAVTALFVTASIAAGPAGRASERLGASRALRIGVACSGLATAAIGAFAQQWWHLAVALVVVGGAVGLIDTGAARGFSDRVAPAAQGTAFGIKEASVPAASLLAGLALPTIGDRLGWRGAFLLALALAAAVWVALPRGGPRRASGATSSPRPLPGTETDAAHAMTATRGPVLTARLARFAIGAGLGAGAATAAATFMVPGMTDRGLTIATAGILLSVASVASIGVRLAAGRWADVSAGVPARAVAILLGVGALGAALLVTPGGNAGTAALAAVLLLGGGWGWTGLAFLAAIRARPDAPATSAGVVLTGLGAGGALGPLGFGAIAAGASYRSAWLATAVVLALGAGMVMTSRHLGEGVG